MAKFQEWTDRNQLGHKTMFQSEVLATTLKLHKRNDLTIIYCLLLPAKAKWITLLQHVCPCERDTNMDYCTITALRKLWGTCRSGISSTAEVPVLGAFMLRKQWHNNRTATSELLLQKRVQREGTKNDFSRNVTKNILTAKVAADWTRAHLNDPLLHITKIQVHFSHKKKKKMDLGGEIKEFDWGGFWFLGDLNTTLFKDHWKNPRGGKAVKTQLETWDAQIHRRDWKESSGKVEISAFNYLSCSKGTAPLPFTNPH